MKHTRSNEGLTLETPASVSFTVASLPYQLLINVSLRSDCLTVQRSYTYQAFFCRPTEVWIYLSLHLQLVGVLDSKTSKVKNVSHFNVTPSGSRYQQDKKEQLGP